MLDQWASAAGIALDFIRPGHPVENCFIESFNGKFRDECLAQQHFATLAEARDRIEAWRHEYNAERPHGSLGYQTPAEYAALSAPEEGYSSPTILRSWLALLRGKGHEGEHMKALVDRYLEAMDDLPVSAHPHFVSPAMREHLALASDPEGLNKEAMRRLIARRNTLLSALPGPLSVFYRADLERITASLANSPVGTFNWPNDVFAKDLCICRGAYVPAGALVVHLESGVPRSVLWKGGLGQVLSAGWFLARKGFRPYYEIHAHNPFLKEFNPEGWDRCYARIALMLEGNPSIRGLMGGSWFYDPKVEEISPRLAYLRRVPLAGGARIYHWGGIRRRISLTPPRPLRHAAT